MMRVWILVPLVSLAVCALQAGQPSEGEAALGEHRARFEAAVGEDYDVTFQRSCFCPPESRQPLRLEVRNGEVQSVTPTIEGAPSPPALLTVVRAVAEVFDLIRDAFGRAAAVGRVDYDPELGYPREVYIDYSERIVDEEQSITLSDLVLVG